MSAPESLIACKRISEENERAAKKKEKIIFLFFLFFLEIKCLAEIWYPFWRSQKQAQFRNAL